MVVDQSEWELEKINRRTFNTTPRYQSEEKENIEYFISSTGNRIHNLSQLRLASIQIKSTQYFFFYINIKKYLLFPKNMFTIHNVNGIRDEMRRVETSTC